MRMVDLVLHPMSANFKAFFDDNIEDEDHSDNVRTKRQGLAGAGKQELSFEPTPSETISSEPESASASSDGEESRLFSSSYPIGRRRKLNYVAVDDSVDGDSRSEHFKRDSGMHFLADSTMADSIQEEDTKDNEERPSSADNATISSDSAHEENSHQPLQDALEICPPNTLRYEMEVEVQRLLQRNKRVLLSKLAECGARRNLTMVRVAMALLLLITY